MATPVERIVRSAQVDNLLELLTDRLSPTDLQSLMLHVYKERAARLTPADVLRQHEASRFVRPSQVSPVAMLELDRLAFSLASPHYEPIELAPVCPLGASSSLSSVHQNNVVATERNSEVVSDSTNCMALECAVRRRALLRSGDKNGQVRLCSSHRLVRAQAFDGPATFAHFRVFALCTAGRDEGSHRFEVRALIDQMGLHLTLIAALQAGGFSLSNIRVAVADFDGRLGNLLQAEVVQPLLTQFPDIGIEMDLGRASGRGYYETTAFQIFAKDPEGMEYFLVDGGFTSWTQQFLSNRKERLLISGAGAERICALFSPA